MSERYFVKVEEDEYWGNEYGVAIRRDGGEEVEVGYLGGGEPEDNVYYRDWAWVVPALNEAYELGYKAGKVAERLGFDV